MHPSVSDILLGEHAQAISACGIGACAFARLNTPKRHALAAVVSITRSKRGRVKLSQVCELVLKNGDGVSLATISNASEGEFPENFFRRIEDPYLWSQKDYRALKRLVGQTGTLKMLLHKKRISRDDLSMLMALPEQWQRAKILSFVDSEVKMRALICLGDAIRFVSGAEREGAFIRSLSRRPSLQGLENIFWRFLYKGQGLAKMPLSRTKHFERIISERQCRKLAQTGHCFGDLNIIEAVLSSETLFYTWSGAKDAIISFERDIGNFGWYIGQACRPKSKSLTKIQMQALKRDLTQLQAKVSLFQWSRKVENAFSRLK